MSQSSNNQNQTKVEKPVPVGLLVLLAFVIFILVNACLLIWASVSLARDAASRTHSRNNLKAIGKAIHEYEFKHLHFPETSIKDESGKPLLSWRVELLPYLGYQDLYDQFDLIQPWDSETNKKLISQMPEIFQCPEMDADEFKTNYLVVVGEQTVFKPEGTTRIRQIIDGPSNTLMAVEANLDQAVIWTQPGDWVLNKKNPFKGIAELRSGQTLFLMADGYVQSLGNNNSDEILINLSTIAGQEDILHCEEEIDL